MVSVGASGAIFGLFAVSVLTRLRFDLRRLLESAILGQFVVSQVRQALFLVVLAFYDFHPWRMASWRPCKRNCALYSVGTMLACR